MVKVKYVGPKHGKRDLTAGTGLVWDPGQVHEVNDDAAAILLRSPDAWVAVGKGPSVTALPPQRDPNEEVLPTPMPRIDRLSKPNLIRLAQARFGDTLDPGMEPAAMRQRIVALENAGRARGV